MKCHKVSFKGTTESDASKKTFNHTTEAKIAFPDLAQDIAANLAATVKCGSDKKLIGTVSACFHFANKYTLGAHLVGNIKEKTKESVTVAGTAAFADSKTAWFKY